MKSEMVERVARAIYEGRNGRGCTAWAHVSGSHKAPYLSDALVALKAMREPNTAMLAAAQTAWKNDPEKRTSTLYIAMLDAEIAAAEKP